MPGHRLSLKPLAYVAVYLGWGTTYLAIRIGLRGLPPAGFLGLRFLLSSGILLALLTARAGNPFARFRGAGLKACTHSAIQGLLLLVAGLLPMACSELTLPSSVTAIVIGCAPAGFAFFDWILNRTPIRGSAMLALALGISGIVLLGWDHGADGGLNVGGLALVIFGCTVWCFGSVVSRKLQPAKDPWVNVLVQYAASGAVLMLIARFGEGFSLSPLRHAGREVFLSLAYISVGPSLVSYTSYLWLLRNEPSARVSTYAFVNPVIAVLAGVLVLGESASPRILGALVLVLGGTAVQFGALRSISALSGGRKRFLSVLKYSYRGNS